MAHAYANTRNWKTKFDYSIYACIYNWGATYILWYTYTYTLHNYIVYKRFINYIQILMEMKIILKELKLRVWQHIHYTYSSRAAASQREHCLHSAWGLLVKSYKQLRSKFQVLPSRFVVHYNKVVYMDVGVCNKNNMLCTMWTRERSNRSFCVIATHFKRSPSPSRTV